MSVSETGSRPRGLWLLSLMDRDKQNKTLSTGCGFEFVSTTSFCVDVPACLNITCVPVDAAAQTAPSHGLNNTLSFGVSVAIKPGRPVKVLTPHDSSYITGRRRL